MATRVRWCESVHGLPNPSSVVLNLAPFMPAVMNSVFEDLRYSKWSQRKLHLKDWIIQFTDIASFKLQPILGP